MSSTTFDAYKAVKALEAAGFSEDQASALVSLQKENFADLNESNNATKTDIARIEKELLLIKWMLGVVIAATVLPLIKSLF